MPNHGILAVPLTVGPAHGPLRALDYTLPMASAQVKTAILLAGLYADGATSVTEPGPSRDHSERMLAYLGAPLVVRGRTTTIDTRGWDRRLAGAGFEVPADPSSAAFLVAGRVAGSRRQMGVTLAALGAGIVLFSLSPWLPLALILLSVAGFGYLSSNTAATTRLALGVAPSQRGRMMALWSIAFLGLRPAASLLDGALAGAFGVRVAGVVLGLPALAGAAFALRRRR